MAEEPVPPLKRAALDQLPAVQQELLAYWSGRQRLLTELLPPLERFDPERLPAVYLAQWVEANWRLLYSSLNPLIRLHDRLSRLQERRPDPEFLDELVAEIDDEAVPTD